MIYTYDKKEKATYDTKGLGEYMKECVEYEKQRKETAITNAEAYYEGYKAALYNLAGTMGASNYRTEGEDE